jgi:hypothetical protein
LGITARQEIHVDGIEDLRTFVGWLVGHPDYPYASHGVGREGGWRQVLGYLRRYDPDEPAFITLTHADLDWPEYS